VAAACVALLLASAPGASAHPLGNATVNHFDGLTLYPDRVVDQAVEDVAEIPTFQRQAAIDTDGNGQLSDIERASYAARQCADMARAVSIVVAGTRVPLTVTTSSYVERPGAIQLKAARLDCQLSGPVTLSGPATVQVDSSWDGAGIGWHEITAVGSGVALKSSPFPARSISAELRKYPNNLLSSPLDVRSGSFDVTPGAGSSTYQAVRNLPVAGFLVRKLNILATAFNNTVGAKHLTVGVGLLAIVLSVLLGAGHAFLPGHGKTIMAAYLVGRKGRLRDVVTVGATVTITHTAGVLLLGLAISTTSAFAPTAAEQYLGVVSGLIVAGVGVGLLVSALRRRRSAGVAGVLRGHRTSARSSRSCTWTLRTRYRPAPFCAPREGVTSPSWRRHSRTSTPTSAPMTTRTRPGTTTERPTRVTTTQPTVTRHTTAARTTTGPANTRMASGAGTATPRPREASRAVAWWVWGLRAAWCPARLPCSSCSPRPRLAVPSSASCSSWATASAWPARCPPPACCWSSCGAALTGTPTAHGWPAPTGCSPPCRCSPRCWCSPSAPAWCCAPSVGRCEARLAGRARGFGRRGAGARCRRRRVVPRQQ